MGQAIQLITGHALNPGATVTAVTMSSGDSATVANFAINSKAYLATAFSPGASAGVARIRSPRMHDNAQGIRLQRAAADFTLLLPRRSLQPLYPGDTLTLEVSGGGAETDVLALLLYYEDLPGVAARLHTWDEIKPQIANIAGVEVDLTAGATAGTYGASVALNGSFDTLKAGVDYAILGYVSGTKAAVVALSGPDTGNLKLGGPALAEGQLTDDYFVELAIRTGLPCIPVINANNKATTNLQLLDVGAGTTSNISMILAELHA